MATATPTKPSGPFGLILALTWNQKIGLIVLSSAVIAGVVALSYFMNREDYQTLYSELGAEEAGTIIEKLKTQKVAYTIDDSGRSIKVPAERVNELRIQLASEGLPQGGKIGFEIFDRTNLGMTEFAERVSYKRALEGELARTMLSLKEIGQVRVHLVLPKESLFQSQSEPTKASVVLKLKSGKQLGQAIVSGIVHLVSSAVEGLIPANVTVVDSNGRMLSENRGAADEALTTTQLELKSRAEKDLTAKIVNILDPVVGAGKVRADASVLIDFSRREQTEETYDPQGVVRSHQTLQEQSQQGPSAVGVPGTKSNSGEPAPSFVPLSSGVGASTKQTETTNYEVSKLVRHTFAPTATIQKLSVAVIVDDAMQNEAGKDGTTIRKAVPRSPDDLKKIRDLVAAAVGIDTDRGDLLTVENIAFGASADSEEAPPVSVQGWRTLVQPTVLQPVLRYVAPLVLFLMAYLFFFRPISKKLFGSINRTAAGQTSGGDLPGAAMLLSLAAPKTVKELEAAMEEDAVVAALPVSVSKTEILKQRIADLVQKDPEKGAQLVRSWLIEEGKG